MISEVEFKIVISTVIEGLTQQFGERKKAERDCYLAFSANVEKHTSNTINVWSPRPSVINVCCYGTEQMMYATSL